MGKPEAGGDAGAEEAAVRSPLKRVLVGLGALWLLYAVGVTAWLTLTPGRLKHLAAAEAAEACAIRLYELNLPLAGYFAEAPPSDPVTLDFLARHHEGLARQFAAMADGHQVEDYRFYGGEADAFACRFHEGRSYLEAPPEEEVERWIAARLQGFPGEVWRRQLALYLLVGSGVAVLLAGLVVLGGVIQAAVGRGRDRVLEAAIPTPAAPTPED